MSISPLSCWTPASVLNDAYHGITLATNTNGVAPGARTILSSMSSKWFLVMAGEVPPLISLEPRWRSTTSGDWVIIEVIPGLPPTPSSTEKAEIPEMASCADIYEVAGRLLNLLPTIS